jgi:rSAM/selenodomain-associated transferase 1
MSSSAVIVMTKAPRAGESKTRLAPVLSAGGAATLAACFFRDACACARAVAGEMVVAYAPGDGRAALEELLRDGAAGRGVHWVAQRGRDLGERLAAAVEDVFEQGLGPVVVIGTDSPTLPPAYVARALDALAGGAADAALGPARDGGYYLVGLARPAPSLFYGVEWSTPRAYRQTVEGAARLGLRLLELPLWYDVDTPADLRRLRAELSADEQARRRAPATYEWLKSRQPDQSREP